MTKPNPPKDGDEKWRISVVGPLVTAAVKQRIKKLLFPTPTHLAANHTTINADGRRLIERSIKENCHAEWPSNVSPEVYEEDLRDHVHVRLEKDRRIIVPWLDSIGTLKGKQILEIGCGTGSSTVALAEQGAQVTGIDVSESGLAVARDRVRVYGLAAKFEQMNATTILDAFGPNTFDLVIFFASLEHMTLDERLTALSQGWKVLVAGGMFIITETPNRLWYLDGHTSLLPFFHWLPDELAFHYSKFSPRENFRELYREFTKESEMQFLRQGRGVSFHELDIAIRPIQELRVTSSLSTFHGMRRKLTRSRLQRRYKSFLMKLCPNIHEAFFDEFLDLAIEKL